jgi:hypothetical protein
MLEGRYPDTAVDVPILAAARIYVKRSEEVMTWLIHQLQLGKKIPATSQGRGRQL